MNNPNARERILQAAIKVFAEKSFEGSRIEEIAKEANAPKSLIYYHFKSKDEILQVLTQNFIDEFTNIIQLSVEETHQEKANALEDKMKNLYYEFGKRNEDLLRIILIDSLKKTKTQPILYQVIEKMMEKEKEFHPESDYDIQERRIAEFFTSFIPNCAYICFADSWINYFKVDKNEFNYLYLKVYGDTHGAYHKNHS